MEEGSVHGGTAGPSVSCPRHALPGSDRRQAKVLLAALLRPVRPAPAGWDARHASFYPIYWNGLCNSHVPQQNIKARRRRRRRHTSQLLIPEEPRRCLRPRVGLPTIPALQESFLLWPPSVGLEALPPPPGIA